MSRRSQVASRRSGSDGTADPPESAERRLGSLPSPHRGWYSRNYLPHCDHPGLLQAITYHLADSLPVEVVERLDRDLSHLPPDGRETARREQVDAWLDAGHGSCVLKAPVVARWVVDNWRRFAGERYDLIAWVVMPNHVHVLIRVYEGVTPAKIVQSWKSYTGRKIKQKMEEDKSRAGARRSQVWMREYWDRFIRDEEHLRTVMAYIHRNPVKAGLVQEDGNWPWSSLREFAG
ncbi:MAG: transposase [Planctomycetota bacterium]